MPELEDRAREVLCVAADAPEAYFRHMQDGDRYTVAVIVKAMLAFRNAALDEAAKVALEWESPLKPGSDDRLKGHREARRNIGAAIEALKGNPS